MDTAAQSTSNGSSPLLNKLRTSFLTTNSPSGGSTLASTQKADQTSPAQQPQIRVSTSDQLQVLESVLNSVDSKPAQPSSEQSQDRAVSAQQSPPQTSAVASQNLPQSQPVTATLQQQPQPVQQQQTPQPVVPLAGQTQPQPVVNQQQIANQQQLNQQAQQQQQPAQSPVTQSPNASQSVQQQSQFPVSPQQPIAARQQNVGMVAQATPTAVDQAMYQQQVQLAQASGGSSSKETVAAGPAVESGASIQYVENEPNPEISPEVSEYLQHAENHHKGDPQEVVIGEAQQDVPMATNMPKQSVVVLPITEEVDKKGGKKGPLHSIRWLVEWSRKLIKKFSGQIIYREVSSSDS